MLTVGDRVTILADSVSGMYSPGHYGIVSHVYPEGELVLVDYLATIPGDNRNDPNSWFQMRGWFFSDSLKREAP